MGVLSCTRHDCPRIMCDTYVDGVGYVCNECQEEFKKYLLYKGLNPQTEEEIKQALLDFIDTNKGQFDKGAEITVDDFFKKHTK